MVEKNYILVYREDKIEAFLERAPQNIKEYLLRQARRYRNEPAEAKKFIDALLTKVKVAHYLPHTTVYEPHIVNFVRVLENIEVFCA